MTREEIIKLAKEIWGKSEWNDAQAERLERFAALVAAKEREACAQVCVDAMASIRGFGTEDMKQIGINVCTNLAKAIRARGMNDGLHK